MIQSSKTEGKASPRCPGVRRRSPGAWGCPYRTGAMLSFREPPLAEAGFPRRHALRLSRNISMRPGRPFLSISSMAFRSHRSDQVPSRFQGRPL
jgi:hypothetical protein